MLLLISDTTYHGRRAVETIDADRRAWALSLAAGGWPPLAAWLFAVKGWSPTIAKAYSLVGTDAGALIDRDTALTAGRARGLVC